MYYIRCIGKRCLSKKEIDSFNSKEKLMEGIMNNLDNNQIKITVLVFFLYSFCLSYDYFVWKKFFIIFVLFLDIWGNKYIAILNIITYIIINTGIY